MENVLVFDVRTDTNDNGGGKVREYRCPARHRIVPYTSIRKSLSSAGKRAGLGHVRPHDLRHTFVTRLLDLSVPIEQVNYLAGHKSMAMTKRYDHANEERYGGAIEALDEAARRVKQRRWRRRGGGRRTNWLDCNRNCPATSSKAAAYPHDTRYYYRRYRRGDPRHVASPTPSVDFAC